MTEKQKKIAMIVTITGVVLLLITLIALVYNLISIGVMSSERARLEAESANLQAVIAGNEEEIEYRDTWEYIEKYARDYLNMKFEDEEVYQPE